MNGGCIAFRCSGAVVPTGNLTSVVAAASLAALLRCFFDAAESRRSSLSFALTWSMLCPRSVLQIPLDVWVFVGAWLTGKTARKPNKANQALSAREGSTGGAYLQGNFKQILSEL